MDDERQRLLALQLRKELDAVVGDEEERRAVTGELDAALALERPEGDRRLTDLLASRDETRAWMRQRDPDLIETERLVELPGVPTIPLGTYFVCPKGDFDFVRETVADEVPVCPTHHLQLISQPD